MMGLSNWLHWLAWFVKYFVFVLISALIETVFFAINTGKNGPVMSYMSLTVLFVFLMAYALATITFCFAASTFFSRGLLLSLVTIISFFFVCFASVFCVFCSIGFVPEIMMYRIYIMYAVSKIVLMFVLYFIKLYSCIYLCKRMIIDHTVTTNLN